MCLSIEQIQNAIMKKGWQWLEHVFNDDLGESANCYIRLSPYKESFVFDNSHPARTLEMSQAEVGWGRFPRQHAWECAYNYILCYTQT